MQAVLSNKYTGIEGLYLLLFEDNKPIHNGLLKLTVLPIITEYNGFYNIFNIDIYNKDNFYSFWVDNFDIRWED